MHQVSSLFRFGSVVACGLACVLACSDRTTTFAVNYAPGYVAQPVKVSVLGVYREGRLDVDGVRALGPELTQTAFHTDSCALAFDQEMRHAKPAVFGALDDATRTDGITEPLLAALAPAAEGDAIFFITMAGEVRSVPDGGGDRSVPSASNSGMGRRPNRGGVGRGSVNQYREPRDTNALDLTATLYSVKEKKVVAQLAMTYTGTSEVEAQTQFRIKLAQTFPNTTCTGWVAEKWPTEDTLRTLPPEQ